MKRVLFLCLMLMVISFSNAQKKFSVYGIGFYNLENLFDYIHDEGKNDYEFLPDGTYKWNEMKYTHKLQNMSRVLSEMGTDVLPNVGCAVIGVSEVENARCLTDLVSQPALKARNFQFAHIEGPDERGVDCALLYNPSLFKVENINLFPYKYELPSDSAQHTRGFLTVSGKLAGDNVAFIVCHWPSRWSGSFYRETAGKQVRSIKDSILQASPSTKVFVMGDLNDDPTNKSLTDALGAKGDIEAVKDGEMFNPWYDVLTKLGTGTLRYDGKWNLFDQIVVTANAIQQKGKKDFDSLKYWKCQVFQRDYLFQTEGKYKGNPKRTTAGGVWLNGYSDHLPVVVYMMKEQK